MTHLPFIAASYAIAILVPSVFAVTTWQRLRQARLRLDALDARRRR